MMSGLTPHQADMLAAIVSGFDGDVAPSIEELCAELNLASKSQAHRLLTALRERGFITWTPGKARTIRLLPRQMTPSIIEAVRLLCIDSVKDGVAASREEITARLAKAMSSTTAEAKGAFK